MIAIIDRLVEDRRKERVPSTLIDRGGEKERRHGDEADTLVRVERMEELVLDRAFDRERADEQVAQTEA